MRFALFVILTLPIWLLGFAMLPFAYLAWAVTGGLRQSIRVLVAIDQLGNALAGGDEDETISSRAGKCARKGGNRFCFWLCRVLHRIDPDHCERYIELDEGERL